MGKDKTTKERGLFKRGINTALYKSADIVDMLLGDTTGMSQNSIREAFKEHVQSHLFVEETITKADTYIFYDIIIPSMRPNTKECRVIMYLICHRDILEDYSKDGYYGNRIDILSQMVEDALINDDNVSNSFGIGELSIDSVDVYNSARFYGCVLTFKVPNFR